MANYSDTPKEVGENIKNILSEEQLLEMEKNGTVPPNEEFFTPEDDSDILHAAADASNLRDTDVKAWQEKLGNPLLVASLTTTAEQRVISFDNLNLREDGGVYTFLLTTNQTTAGYPNITVNDINTGYSKTTIFTNALSDGAVAVEGYAAENQAFWGVGNMLGRFMLEGTLTLIADYIVFCSTIAHTTKSNYHSTYINGGALVTDNITKLTFSAPSPDSAFPAGTTIKIYKKAT